MIDPNTQYRCKKLDINTGKETDVLLWGHEIAGHWPEIAEPKIGQHVQDYTLYTITTMGWE